jgi:ABC-type multidrug transport system ATPase subunit
MGADRIIVVMDGKIVEEGTHDELIHGKGKYHQLWSKQVYVKPGDARGRSLSPKKRDVDIINDLTPSRQKAELAKVLHATARQEPDSHESSNEHSVDPTSRDSSDEPSEGTHTKHASKLANVPSKPATKASGKGKSGAVGGHKREVSNEPH